MSRVSKLEPSSGPTAPALSDAEVVTRVLGGERDAYAVLVGRYQEGLFRFALGMVASNDAAADLVQEAFVKAYETLHGCRDPERFAAWIRRIVRNRCLDHLKRNRLRNGLVRNIDLEAARAIPAAEVEESELREVLRAALESLPEPQREAFLLKHLEELTYEEISESCGASVSALKMRVKRARESLRKALAGKL